MKILKNKIAVFSDLHLGIHLNSQEWHNVTIKWVKWFKEQLQDQNIKDIIFCGDWYDSRSEIAVDTLHTSAEILDILAPFNKIMLIGNHDTFYRNRTDVHSLSLLKDRKNLTIIDTPQSIICSNNKKLFFCPWNTQIDQIEACDILFGHFEVVSFKKSQWKDCEKGISPIELLEKSPLVISGHFHTRHSKSFAQGKIVYVGNPFEMTFGDINNKKGYYILDTDDSNLEFFENDISPQHKRIKLSEITSITEHDIRNNIIDLQIDVKVPEKEILHALAVLNGYFPFYLTHNISYTAPVTLNITTPKITISDSITEFIQQMDITDKMKEHLTSYLLPLYTQYETSSI